MFLLKAGSSVAWPRCAAIAAAFAVVLPDFASIETAAQSLNDNVVNEPSSVTSRPLNDIDIEPPTGFDKTTENADPVVEPVFTLGPMPLLPPASWSDENDTALEDIDKKPVDKGPSTSAVQNSSSQNKRNDGEASSSSSIAQPISDQINSPSAEPPASDTTTNSSSVSGTTQDSTLAPTQDSPTAPADIRNSTPAESGGSNQVVTDDSDRLNNSESQTEPSFTRRQPAMEQVDVTAKRLPPPSPVVAPESGFSVSSAPPPGFEDLAGAQTTLVDVMYGKRIIVSTMATFDMGMLEFNTPEEVIAAIPGAKDSIELNNALTGPLDTNADALCYSDYDTECGRLQPQIAAIIFDENRFRVELFVHPDYLETSYLAGSMYLPPSDSGAASVHSFSLAANGDQTSQLINLSANSLVSYGESRIESQYDLDGKKGLSIDTLSLKHDARGWELEGGAFRSRIQSAAFLTEYNLLGARVSTSLNTRTDLDFAEATPLFAYIEQRARVDILRGTQLLDSRFYEAGNRQLDTSRLPHGAYNVTVRVVDDSGASTESEYYFSRTSALPPKDQPLYFAEAGQLAVARESVLPELTDSLWLRAGTAHRLRDDFGVEASVSSIGDATLVEGGVIWFQPGLQLQAMLLGGDSSGLSVRTVWQRDQFSLSADLRYVSGDEALSVDSVDLLPASYTQANVSATFPFFDGRMLAQGRWDMRGSRDFKSIGFNYSRELRQFANSNLSMTVDTSFSSDDSIVRLGVDWRWREQSRDALIRPRIQYSGNSGAADALLSARYNVRLKETEEGTYRASASIDRSADSGVIAGRVSGENARGVGEFELQYGFEGERTGVAYVANSRFGIVSSGSQVAFGGRRSNASSIIVEINGNAPDAVFEVLIGKQSHGYAKSGSRTLIALPPYETYDVRLAARGTEFVEFEESVSSVTLYPGNVKTLTFTANRQIVVIGQVVDEEGYTIAHHHFTDLDGFASTDENGWFQIEITDVKPLTLKRGEASICTIEFDLEDPTENLVVLDQLICK